MGKQFFKYQLEYICTSCSVLHLAKQQSVTSIFGPTINGQIIVIEKEVRRRRNKNNFKIFTTSFPGFKCIITIVLMQSTLIPRPASKPLQPCSNNDDPIRHTFLPTLELLPFPPFLYIKMII